MFVVLCQWHSRCYLSLYEIPGIAGRDLRHNLLSPTVVREKEERENYTGWAFILDGMRRRITISGTWAEVFTLMSKFAFFPVDPR